MSLRQPPEWAPHESVWIGFPSDASLWEADLAPARGEVAAFAEAIHANGRGEAIVLVVADAEGADEARTLAPFAQILTEPFGDIWLRDTGPIIVGDGAGRSARAFRFNGWGGKYRLAGDEDIADRLAARIGLTTERDDWVCEGGAIDGDGTGLMVTTEQCLLNPNRNPGLTKRDIEKRLARSLSVTRLMWLGDGLLADHTDGHVDNLARFVGNGRLAIPVAEGDDDPNRAVYDNARARALEFGLDVVPLPSPGRIERNGEIVPASYMNFYIGNAAVAVPIHGAANDEEAVKRIGDLFPGRQAIGLASNHLLTGGGSFHCISQQVPA